MNTLFLSASDTKISDAALYSLVGFLIVLAVLALLVAIFYLTGFLFGHTALGREKLFVRKDKKQRGETAKSAENEEVSDGDVIAAITAAIAVMLESENGGVEPEFVIRRVTRKK